tara:strand:+ start:8072 stop:8251 length:180 start_codon:yes stop_codon:yes gene_type:complete
MNLKIKAWEYLQKIKEGIGERNAELVLLELIKNGCVNADDLWKAENIVEAYESVMGEEE